jgi:magnesium-protoporphyrin O-methyltransferase
MAQANYLERRGQIEHYFDRTAAQAWERLTSTAPVGRIRATVRAGRDRMRETLLGWMPADLHGARLLDAGCGTGALAVAAARRGAEVVAIDLSPTLVDIARQRLPEDLAPGRGAGHIDFRSGDMLDAALGRFDYVVGMDSLIHYQAADAVRVLTTLAARTDRAMLFTYAPSTPLLETMHAVGRLFPKSDRAPSIEPVGTPRLLSLISREAGLEHFAPARTLRVASGFYTSQALELARR